MKFKQSCASLSLNFFSISRRRYSEFKRVMSPSDFSHYEKMCHYRVRAFSFYRKQYARKNGKGAANMVSLEKVFIRLNLEMIRACVPYGIVPNVGPDFPNRKGQDVSSFILEMDEFLGEN